MKTTHKKQNFRVFNYTDNIFASELTFTSLKEANLFIDEFRQKFKIAQGYYFTNNRERISPNDIDLLAIPENFNPYKMN